MLIRPASEDDLPGIVEIYNDAVDNTVAIWNNDRVDVDNRRAWLTEHQADGFPILVAVVDDRVAGYASLSHFRDFQGFVHTAENSIYVHPDFRGRGIASALMRSLIDDATGGHLHVIVAAIEGANAASIALHRKLGFVPAGTIPECGTKFGEWLDMHLMYLRLPAQ